MHMVIAVQVHRLIDCQIQLHLHLVVQQCCVCVQAESHFDYKQNGVFR